MTVVLLSRLTTCDSSSPRVLPEPCCATDVGLLAPEMALAISFVTFFTSSWNVEDC